MLKVQTEPFRKAASATAAEICSRVELSPEAKAFLVPGLSPQGFLSLLIEGAHVGDAVRFLAFSLPVREGVWWACVIANSTMTAPGEADRACLAQAAAWVYEPVDGRRYKCLAAAEAAKLEGPAAYAALAAYWSGGSLAPEGMPEAPADPSLGPIGVGASVLLSLAIGDPVQLPMRFAKAMQRGIDIANGGNGRVEGDTPLARGN